MTRLNLFVALFAVAACAGDQTQQKADSLNTVPPTPPASVAVQPAAPAPPALELSSRGGPAGSKVTVTMSGLVLHAHVAVGFGSFGEHEILMHDTATVDGFFKATVTIPPATTPGTYYFFLQDNDNAAPFGRPLAYVVTTKDGTARVSGTLGTGAECPTVKSVTEEVYSLTGAKNLPAPGTEVAVVGKIVDQSTCQQGITIAVQSVTPK
jgi:hypothetical protein